MPAELSIVTEPLPKSQVGMTIEVPAELVAATYERVLNRLTSKAKIEGFRPGRAPRALVEARVGPAALREEVVETIVPQVVRQALEEESIDPIDNPDVEVLELERGRPARLKATVSVMPQVTLGDASSLAGSAPAGLARSARRDHSSGARGTPWRRGRHRRRGRGRRRCGRV